ncbi:MAG: metallophosphoesterase [Syntrophorhabdales bacterium]
MLRQGRFRYGVIVAIGLAMGILSALNAGPVFRRAAWVEPSWGARIFFFYLPAIWTFGSIFSALFLGLTSCAGVLTKTAIRYCRRRVHRKAGPDTDRRRFLRAGVFSLAVAPFIVSGYGATYVGRKGRVTELTLSFGLAIKVAQLTDIHAGVYMTRKDIRRYVDMVVALEPDLFVLTGDFISNSMVFLPDCLEEVVRVQARYGTFAVVGNHERWFGRSNALRAVFDKYDIPLLVNTHRMVQTERGPFAVAGIDDLRTGHPSLDKALLRLDSRVPTLLLSHRPEIFTQAAARGIPLTLAGHYHGGQIKVAGISLAHLVTPYPEGLFAIGRSCLYVSRGIGTTFTPIRLGVPAEVTLLHLT